MPALYTAEDLEQLAANGTRRLVLAAGDRLTPLARDRAAELGLTLEYGAAGAAEVAKPSAVVTGAAPARQAPGSSAQLDSAALRKLYHTLFTVRELEERLEDLAKEHKTKGALHLCVGQEAVGVGAGAALTREDIVTSTHRGHAHFLGKGLDLGTMTAELWGKAEGQNRGRSGHQLMSDPKIGLLGGSGIVGGNVPMATGQALAFKMRGHPAVVCAFFGDGAINIGHVHESLNLAGLWKLPIIFVCEHNQYGLTVHSSAQIAVEDVVIRAPGYGMAGYQVDGNDTLAVYDVVAEARARALAGEGPTFVEAKTYRLRGFSTGDLGGYQPKEDIEAWAQRDPVPRLRGDLLKRAAASESEVDALEGQVRSEVAAALEHAQQAPDPTPDELGKWAWLR